MWETAEELSALQGLLDVSFGRASEHLKSIMTPERQISAPRLVSELPSPAVLNIATVTARGEPRVSAVDGHFLHGHWYWTTAADSPKARQLRARPAISASFTPRDGFGMFCHGRAGLLDAGPERHMVTDHFAATYGQAPEEWATEITYVRIDAAWLVAFAMTDDEMAQIEADRAARAGDDG
ncbi:MAG: pyridoxamine 5-phosphate oxidase-related FMN-binding protein [Pseudonocardiales bacterium]|nr:pyridoxamine 5-phosphate oxidase-related FMN-binding protein [Pseudonocardiales bacterium]